MRSPQLRAWLAGAFVFGLGLVLGSAATVFFGARQIRHALEKKTVVTSTPERTMERIVRDLADELSLTPAEAATVRAELTASAAALKRVRTRAAQDLATEVGAVVERIANGLPAEKRPALRRLARDRFSKIGIAPMPGVAAP